MNRPMNVHSTSYIPADDILFTEVNDEMVLYDPNRGLDDGVYILDDIGARIWQLIIEHGTKARIASQLMLEYDVDEVTVNRAVEDLILQMVKQRFLIAVHKEVG